MQNIEIKVSRFWGSFWGVTINVKPFYKKTDFVFSAFFTTGQLGRTKTEIKKEFELWLKNECTDLDHLLDGNNPNPTLWGEIKTV
jgi:hypothetical protein